MRQVIYREVRGLDYTPDLAFAFRAFRKVLAFEILMDLKFFLAALSGLPDVLIDVDRHCETDSTTQVSMRQGMRRSYAGGV